MDKLGEHLNLAPCGYGFQDSHLHHYLTSQSLLYLFIIRILVCTQILNQIGFCLVVLLTVGDIHFDILP